MSEIATIGLDLAKNVFQIHAVDAADGAVPRRMLRRAEMLRFLPSRPPASSAWRPAPPRTNGRERSVASGTKCE